MTSHANESINIRKAKEPHQYKLKYTLAAIGEDIMTSGFIYIMTLKGVTKPGNGDSLWMFKMSFL